MNEKLTRVCDEYMEFVESYDDYCDDRVSDFENAIVEAAMQQRFGASAYDRINAAIQRHEDGWRKEQAAERIPQLEAELAALRAKYPP